jgi:hypothetical protein
MVLPPCIVCGKTEHGLGWTWTLAEAEATELLGQAPPETQSVIDPEDDRRLWVAHGDCTGVTQRTAERSADELRERLELQSQAEARGLPWRAAKWPRKGTCVACSRPVSFMSTKPLLPEYRHSRRLLRTLAWRCDACRRWICHECGQDTSDYGSGLGHPHAIHHFGCGGSFWRAGFSRRSG